MGFTPTDLLLSCCLRVEVGFFPSVCKEKGTHHKAFRAVDSSFSRRNGKHYREKDWMCFPFPVMSSGKSMCPLLTEEIIKIPENMIHFSLNSERFMCSS